MKTGIRLFNRCKKCGKIVFINIELIAKEYPVYCKRCSKIADKLIDEMLNIKIN